MTVEELRDAILGSLQTQFRFEVRSVSLLKHGVAVLEPNDPRVEAFLLNVANNVATGLCELAVDEETRPCHVCNAVRSVAV